MDKISPFYNDAVQQIKSAILESQLETARAANKQMLSLYYAVGKFVSENSRKGTWGNAENEEKSAKIPIFALLDINRPPMAGDLDFSEFLELSFTHHMEILLKTSTLEERAFYIHQALINHCSKCQEFYPDDWKGFHVRRPSSSYRKT